MTIEEACYNHPWTEISFDQILQDHRTFSTLAARTNGKGLAGYVVYSIVADELHILNVAINPKYRRQHLATLMLMQIHQKALTSNCQKAFLEVRESNSAAQNLYLKFGYKSVSRRKDYYTDTHEDALVMTASLKS